jgi:hypothetical protein
MRSWLMLNRTCQKSSDPVAIGIISQEASCVFIMARWTWTKDVARVVQQGSCPSHQAHPPEKGDHGVIEREVTFSNGQPGSRGRKALTQRIQHVRVLGGIGCPPPFGNDMTVAQEHYAV